VTVSVELPDLDGTLTPASGIVVTALPFDRDSLVLTMEARAGSGRPGTEALDSLFALYREPFLEYFRAGQARESARDSLAAGTISQAEHDQLESRYQAAREALQKARDQLDPAIDSLRAEVREWEHSTYRGFDTLARVLSEGRGRAVVTDTTDAQGVAVLRIPPSTLQWRVTATAWNVSDPNSVWYWSVAADKDSVALNPGNAVKRGRY
jgi:hypothetical protein